ncbi:hypothetical protein AB0K34_13900 [Actinomadura sp. NPDC049382]|uniref:hypothetical protein n=1 Tax=Actinomadura sp. NPDC049382 TaxID=3158220 RepID=UPI0034317C28
MPLLTRTPGTGGPPTSGTRSRHALQVTYIDPDGHVWDWSTPGSQCRALSVTGIGGPPAAYTDTSLAGGGSLPQAFSAAKRSIVIGLHVFDDTSQAGLLDLLDRLTFALWHDRAGVPTPGVLRFARPDGTARQIEVFCTSGPPQTEEEASRDAYQRDTSYGLTFESGLDSLFQDADPVGPLVFAAPPVSGGVPPMPPVLLTPSTTLGETTVYNTGNGDAYPTWTITGPGVPTLTNVTTGREFSLGVTLSAGEVITVDTRPTLQSAIDQDGVDRWGDLVKSTPRDLWTLVPGANLLNLELASAGTGSQISMLYHRRWLRA